MRQTTLQVMVAVILSLLAGATARAQAEADAADAHLDLPPNHSVEPVLVATGMERAFGVAVNEDHAVYAPTYRVLGGVGVITPEGKASLLCRLEQLAPIDGGVPFAIGARLDKLQRLIVADGGGGRVLRLETDGAQADVLADRYEGVKLRIVTHVAPDRAGNIFFTECGDNPEAKDGRVFVYQIHTQKLALVAEKLAHPSGLAVSPDQAQLYVAERGSRSVTCFKLDKLKASERRTLIAFPKSTEGEITGGNFEPMGMACDRKGRLYVAMSAGGVINVIEAPSGRLLRQYRTNAEVADCHFDNASLYVALPKKEAIFRLPLGVEGFIYWK